MLKFEAYASGSSGNLYTINDGRTWLIIECGIPLREIRQQLRYRTHELNGCFISHAHQDHSKAAKDLVKLGVDIYTSQGTIAACKLTGHRIHAVKALEELTVGTFKVLPFDVQHDAPEPLGFLFASIETGEKLLYFTDTFYIKYKFQGLNIIAAECNYDKETLQRSVDAGYVPIELLPRLMKSHMSLEHFIDLLKANDLREVRQIYLLHLSNNNSDEKKFKEEVQKLTGTEVYVC